MSVHPKLPHSSVLLPKVLYHGHIVINLNISPGRGVQLVSFLFFPFFSFKKFSILNKKINKCPYTYIFSHVYIFLLHVIKLYKLLLIPSEIEHPVLFVHLFFFISRKLFL